MHLLARQSETLDGSGEAIDLGQRPADCIVLSAADSELALLARAFDRLSPPKPSLRLANLMALGHHLSVDSWIERTAATSKLVVVRLLGGRGYWTYGVDELVAMAQRRPLKLALLPGGRDPDPALAALSTIPPAACQRLHRYLAEGGSDNAANFLRYCAELLGSAAATPPPVTLPHAGVYGLRDRQDADAPIAAILFYRALIEGGLTAPVDRLASALATRGLQPFPIFIASLKDDESAKFLKSTLERNPPAVILNATAFAAGRFDGEGDGNPLADFDCPVLQVIFSGSSAAAWSASSQGLSPRDLAMNVVLPELDGRIITSAASFKEAGEWHAETECSIMSYRPEETRIERIAELAAGWVGLRRLHPARRRIAIVLANYPNRDGRIANGVGYDTPASTVAILDALAAAGYRVDARPRHGNELIAELMRGPTNSGVNADAPTEALLPVAAYRSFFDRLPSTARQALLSRWGEVDEDPFCRRGAFRLPVRLFGHVAIGIQPARGYNIDPKSTYHDSGLVPPHGYLAFYLWLREVFGAHAVIHNGKHGNVEWLPGKATALSDACWPDIALGPVPQLYPFIVNDPGEGTQAKRRTAAVIIDHLTPPLSRAESYGPLRELESLIDEYAQAAGIDARRQKSIRSRIAELVQSSGIDRDAAVADIIADDAALARLDAWLCDVKESQIRDGLHILGSSPEGRLETDLLVALSRLPRRQGLTGDASLLRALAQDLDLAFDPLAADLSEPWEGTRPPLLAGIDAAAWRSLGDTVERLELLAAGVVAGSAAPPGPASAAVKASIETEIRPAVRACGGREIAAVLDGLAGRFVAPGPAGAPSRGRLDVLPTGRNFYSLDNRAVPTPTAFDLGRRSAEAMLARHFQDHGRYPTAIGLSVWGTSNMRTGGDDIAQALALLGARPQWEPGTGRVTGFEILTLAELGRPRIDVTLRISGFFRDAFPLQIALFDKVARAVGDLDEDVADNPVRKRMHEDAAMLLQSGLAVDDARRLAAHRIFSSKPGTYGAGLQALIDERLWQDKADLARAYLAWGSHAYGSDSHGEASETMFRRRLSAIEAVVHNQDNREHDLLDSDDYYQFEGGMTVAVEHVAGVRPVVWHNDHSRPERPLPRTLEEEIARVMRARVVNPKWIAGMMRHGYKGAFEIAATVDYMFAFAATTGAVQSHHFDLAYDAYLGAGDVRAFLADNNPAALAEIAARFAEAVERGLWSPRSNSAWRDLQHLRKETAA
ncbi:MAG TPA: cobaltochelatase subunit CobN [Aestuariivirgaceae bacterium]|nr:cobaltochelatase subunit CobN [Aestuariivirgaceae bacterium]